MKHGKRLTRDQKILLTLAGWDPDRWLIVRELEHSLVLSDRETGEIVIFEKEW